MHERPGELLVRGSILFPPDLRPFRDATVRVRLEDVSRADAPATLIQEHVQENVSLETGPARLAFELHGSLPDPRAEYAVRVHVDLDGDGQITREDYISTSHYPVPASGGPTSMDITVRRV